MNSITISDHLTGKKLIRVWKNKKGEYWAESLNSIHPIIVKIKDGKETITIRQGIGGGCRALKV